MCGLVGIVDPTRRYNGAAHTRLMADAIRHRGPDDHQDWQDEILPVAMSFRRLAILDLSQDGAQPMHEGPLTIVFNGEIYNYKELRAELESGHAQFFRSTSDTEVLLKGFLIWGIDATLRRVNGMYGFALLDRRDTTLTLGRDRFGEKPLYYINNNKNIIFSSEIKSLKTVLDLEIDAEASTLFLRYGFIPAPKTIAKDVSSLRPGEWIRFEIATCALIERQVIPFADPGQAMRLGSAQDGFDAALTRSLDLRLRADVPVGVFLSGGVDSSLLLLLAKERLGRALPSFTIQMAGAGEAYDEAPQAARLAQYCGSEHHLLRLDEHTLLDAIPGQIAAMDQPLADAAIIPTALLSHMARKHVTVALGGEGGDELQAGYTRHAQEGLFKSLRVMMKHDNGFSGMVFKGLWAGAGLGASLGLPQLKRQMDKLERTAGVDATSAYDALMTLWPVSVPRMAPDGDFRDADAGFYLPNDLLMKLDGATMQASLEGRCPYLDPVLWATLAHYPRDAWRGKKLGKNLLSRLAPPDLMPRAKRGLTLPMGPWLRGALKDWAADHVASVKDMAIASSLIPAIDQSWSDLQSGRSDHAQPIWALCVFSAWLRAQNLSI